MHIENFKTKHTDRSLLTKDLERYWFKYSYNNNGIIKMYWSVPIITPTISDAIIIFLRSLHVNDLSRSRNKIWAHRVMLVYIFRDKDRELSPVRTIKNKEALRLIEAFNNKSTLMTALLRSV